MEYRPAEAGDIETILRIVKDAAAEMESRGIRQWDAVYPAKADFLADIEKNEMYVGLQDGEIAVLYTVNKDCDAQYANGSWRYPDSEYRVLHRFCVDPKYQNRGIGKRTLAHIEDALRGSGVETVRLDVFCGNPFALALYRGSFYEEVGIARWRKGEFFLMEKHL